MSHKKDLDSLFELIKTGVTPFHVTKAIEDRLLQNQFEKLEWRNDWAPDHGGKYYFKHHDSSIFAFTIGKDTEYFANLKMAACHTDFPCLRVKGNPEMITEGYMQLNVEVYGGAILNTWLDRPLSVAGRVSLKSDQVFKPNVRLVDFKRPILTIPNLAIHLNREINSGVELNKQNHMKPILGMLEDTLNKEQFFLKALAQELDTEPENILDFELSLYNMDEPLEIGLNQELVSAPRLDNLTSVDAVLSGIIEEQNINEIHIAAFFDHEEIGSKTKQGAGSNILNMLTERIYTSLNYSKERMLAILEDAILISADVGHAIHPNYTQKGDQTNKGILNKGFAIKESSNQGYATDCEVIGIVQQICEKADIPYQKLFNRSDGTSGSTLGSIASAMLPVKTIDIGVPLLAMHSARELMGKKDQEAIKKLITTFYSLQE